MEKLVIMLRGSISHVCGKTWENSIIVLFLIIHGKANNKSACQELQKNNRMFVWQLNRSL